MGYDDLIDSLAATQHGVVARQQLLAAGVPRHPVSDRLRSGRLIPLHAGVYAVRGHRASWHQRLLAACLAAGPEAAVSHRGAAYLHQLAGVEPRVEVSVAVRRAPKLVGVQVHRAVVLRRSDVEMRDGIPRTKLARTLIDLAAVVPPTTLTIALGNALSRRITTVDHLRRALDALGTQGRRGASTLVRLLANDAVALESRFERRLFELLAASGLPLPVPQFEVDLPDGRRARLDFAYPERLLALEADSYRHHSSRADWARDHTRNRLLTAVGWRIIPVTWEDLAEPAALADLVARSLNGFAAPSGKTARSSRLAAG